MTATHPSLSPGAARPFACALLALLLAACSSAPPKEEDSSTPTSTALRVTETSLQLPPSIYDPQFAAADTALASRDWMSAEVALYALDGQPLTATDAAHRTYLEARIAHLRGDQETAMASLAQLDQPGLHPGLAYRVHNFQRHLLDIQGRYLESAHLGVRIMEIAPLPDHPALKRSIWLDLERSDGARVAAARAAAGDETWAGWLDLVTIANRSTAALPTDLAQWRANYPGHPATGPLPGGLQYLAAAPPAPPSVALLLPLSGPLAPAGKAIRDGYLARYYQARSQGDAPYEVLVIDTEQYPGATEAYNEASARGAQLIVGPLRKASVEELALSPARTLPVLALNRIDRAAAAGETALVQLALSPEDEAAQLARLAFGRGGRNALILRPAGPWGDKIETALVGEWQQLGAAVTASIRYTGPDDYSASVKSGLGIAASEERRRKLRDTLATNIEFTPRRREDIDLVFMLANNPAEARAIKPLLAFHYAGQLPVYATSSVYAGHRDSRDRDLDGTHILELPWLLGSNPALAEALASSGSDQYSRLNALGADAYLLQSRLPQLQAGPDALIKGDTGLLSMNARLQIERQLLPATFDRDRLSAD